MMVRTLIEPVADLVTRARDEFAGKPFSDVLDAEGRQYVDLVMGGNGVLGFALAGYTHLLEAIGLRFLRVGGTGAGAVNALGLAALGPPATAKSTRLAAELIDLDPWRLVDGGPAARGIVQDYLAGRPIHRDRPAGRLALNPGLAFREWLAALVGQAGITTGRQLRDRMRERPTGLRLRSGDRLTADDADPRLAVVATELATESPVELPRMASCYGVDPNGLNPADFGRAAASVPFFFEPARLPGASAEFVDGGVVAPFPIDLFHEPRRPPIAPTFGVKQIAADERVPHFDALLTLTTGVSNAARHARDHAFIQGSADYRQLMCVIDLWKQHWMGFDLTPDDKLDQFQRGAEAAVRFLRGFDWPAYREEGRLSSK